MEKERVQYQVKTALVCDDYRREDNGKDILIGIYNREAIFVSWPAGLPKLVFYTVVEGNDLASKEFILRVVDDEGKQRVEIKGTLPETAKSFQVMNFQILGVGFKTETRLDFLFGINREPELVASLQARLANTDDERRRLSSRT